MNSNALNAKLEELKLTQDQIEEVMNLVMNNQTLSLPPIFLDTKMRIKALLQDYRAGDILTDCRQRNGVKKPRRLR